METDLHRVIQSRQELTDEHIQQFVQQLLRGVLQMHSTMVIHRDLKPSNLLLNKNCDLKICDLGLARGTDIDGGGVLTEQVVTRWQRAPEVILNASHYSEKIDVWSIGCILAELLGRTPIFPGEDQLDQVQHVVNTLGTPIDDDIAFIGNESAKRYIKNLPKKPKQEFSKLQPKADPTCLDLISRMLVFAPHKRYSIRQCLEHPQFEGLHNPDEEPISDTFFDWSFDDFEPTKELLQSMVQDEGLHFHPEPKKSNLPSINSNTSSGNNIDNNMFKQYNHQPQSNAVNSYLQRMPKEQEKDKERGRSRSPEMPPDRTAEKRDISNKRAHQRTSPDRDGVKQTKDRTSPERHEGRSHSNKRGQQSGHEIAYGAKVPYKHAAQYQYAGAQRNPQSNIYKKDKR